MTANMYRVGDYVYFETSSTSPYQIRRIEELNKTASGNVEAKVMCFYRRRDLPSPLIQLADKHQCALDESTTTTGIGSTSGGGNPTTTTPGISTAIPICGGSPATSDSSRGGGDTSSTTTTPLTNATPGSTGGGGVGDGSSPPPPPLSSLPPLSLSLTTSSTTVSTTTLTSSASTTTTTTTTATGGSDDSGTPPLPVTSPSLVTGGGGGGVTMTTTLAIAVTSSVTTTTMMTSPTTAASTTAVSGGMTNSSNSVQLSGKQRHQMKHRELFLSRQVETLPATHIRGKCSVTLFNETESLASYLHRDDVFFYCLVFDPAQKTLLADKGEIRVGSRYQSDVTALLREAEREIDPRVSCDLETLVWTPEHALSDRQIDQFLVVSRSVGTFARALDCSSSVKQPSLHMSAAAASRDITLFHAMDTLHKHTYDLSGALCSLVPSSGPVLCRDEMEEWSASEANLFEEALDKYGKDFNDIRQDFLPWKTLKNIVEYYYMWKTTDRYVQQKRVKAVEAESKLKQVYIPNYNKPNPAAIIINKGIVNGSSNGTTDPAVSLGGKACESCNVTVSSQWYSWGPPHMQCRLCHVCWQYWKRYGGLKIPSRFSESAAAAAASAIPPASTLSSGGVMEYDLTTGGSVGVVLPGGGGGKKKSASVAGSDDADEDKMSGVMSGGGGGGGGALSHRPHRCTIGGCGKEFKLKAHLGRHYATAHGMMVRSGSPRPIMKTRSAFYLHTTPQTRMSRRVCRHIIRPRHASRAPLYPINIQAVKAEYAVRVAGKLPSDLKQLLVYRAKCRGSVTGIANRLGNPGSQTPQWLILTNKDLLPKPLRMMFPKPPKAPDGSLLYERVPNKPEAEKIPLNNVNISPSLKRRNYDDMNGIDSGGTAASLLSTTGSTGGGGGGPPPKRLHKDPSPMARHEQYSLAMSLTASSSNTAPLAGNPLLTANLLSSAVGVALPAGGAMTGGGNTGIGVGGGLTGGTGGLGTGIGGGTGTGGHAPRHIAQINGKPKIAHMTRTGSGRKQVISWMDAPDDLYFRATETSKKVRRQISSTEMRRIARKPWRAPKIKDSLQVVVLD